MTVIGRIVNGRYVRVTNEPRFRPDYLEVPLCATDPAVVELFRQYKAREIEQIVRQLQLPAEYLTASLASPITSR